jgi:hypothetical protein
LRRFPRSVGLADALTPAALAVCVWVVVASTHVVTGIVPGAVAAAFVALDYRVWRARGTPWHDPLVIVLLLPALAAALWLGIGGIVLGVDRGAAGRLLLEVGPGLALTGLVTTLISYHGRHRP